MKQFYKRIIKPWDSFMSPNEIAMFSRLSFQLEELSKYNKSLWAALCPLTAGSRIISEKPWVKQLNRGSRLEPIFCGMCPFYTFILTSCKWRYKSPAFSPWRIRGSPTGGMIENPPVVPKLNITFALSHFCPAWSICKGSLLDQCHL